MKFWSVYDFIHQRTQFNRTMNSIINQLQIIFRYVIGMKVMCILHTGLHELSHDHDVVAQKFLRRENITRALITCKMHGTCIADSKLFLQIIALLSAVVKYVCSLKKFRTGRIYGFNNLSDQVHVGFRSECRLDPVGLPS